MPFPLLSRPVSHLALFTLAALVPATAATASQFVDSFDDGDVTKADGMPAFWLPSQPDNSQGSGAAEVDGHLHLRAANWPYMWVSMSSPVMEDFGFFSRPVTVTLEDVRLVAEGIDQSLARFKVSLASSRKSAEKAEDVISIRVRSGLLLLGYRADGYSMDAPPETLTGQKPNAVIGIPLSGVPTKLSLTLGPSQSEGLIRYEIRIIDNGASIIRAGTLPLTISQWGNTDAASLILDARRDSDASLAGSHTDFSVGQVTVSR